MNAPVKLGELPQAPAQGDERLRHAGDVFERLVEIADCGRTVLMDVAHSSDGESLQLKMLAVVELIAMGGLLAELGLNVCRSSGPAEAACLSHFLGAHGALAQGISAGGIER
jgi:hypothetical protein